MTSPALSSSVLAVATTVHLALASLRNHRRPGRGPLSSFALVSVLFAALPWMFPSAAGLLAGFVGHAVWFAICERFVPRAQSSAAASAPATRSAPAAAPAAEHRRGFVATPVLAVIDETADIKTFRFARPADFDFLPGQFVTLRINVDGKNVARCYSISSAPAASAHLDVSVKRLGVVSGALHATLRPGAVAMVHAPAGKFTYPSGDLRPLLLLAGGIGITPVLSMLRHAVLTEPARPVTLLYSAKTEEDLAFRDEIAAIARAHPQVRVVFAVTRGAAGPHIFPGRIDDALIQATVPRPADAIACICGPQPMIDGLNGILRQLGVPAGQIRSEAFEPAAAAAAGLPRAAPSAAAGSRAPHRVTCARSATTLDVAPHQTLLEAAEAGGVGIESLCRAGVCGTCRTRVLSGDVDCASGLIDAVDRDEGYVLACVSHARGDCTIEA